MLKGILKLSLFLALALIFLGVNAQAQILSLTDENVIGLTLDHLKKAIQKTDTLRAFEILGTQISIKGKATDPRSQVRSIFEQAESRKTVISPPPKAENRKFWDLDFEITDFKINIEEGSAQVKCQLKLWAAKTDTPRTIKKRSEVFRFKKVDKGWRLVGFDNLLDFLRREVSPNEED